MSATTIAGPGRASLYLRATRYPYLPTSLLPGAAGGLVAIGVAGARWWLLVPALIALLLVHCGTNVINDVEDHARGVDTAEKMDNSRVFNTGLLSVREGRFLAWALFAAGAVIGVAIGTVQGIAVVVIGLVGSLGGYLYTAGPRPFKYLGLGDSLIILLMGPLITQGAYAAVTGDGFHAPAFFLGFAPGFLVAAVVSANNLSDIPADAAAGVRTLAVRFGFSIGRAVNIGLLTATYATIVILFAAGWFGPAILLPLLTGPIAWSRVAQARAARGPGDSVLTTLALSTAQLHLVFCALLIAGVVIDRGLAA